LVVLVVFVSVCGGIRVPKRTGLPPDTNRNTTEIIRDKGYPCEEHNIVTQDGFILLAQRIPHGKKGSFVEMQNAPKKVVFLQPGLFCTTGVFVLNYIDNLAYVLADAGFDVWLVNSRNVPFPRHTSIPPSDKRVWEWTYDELAQYDVPAAVDYILSVTKVAKISAFIGHSQGGTIGWALFTSNSVVSAKVDLFIPLAGPAGPPNVTLSLDLEGGIFCTECTDSWPGCCAGVLGLRENMTLTKEGCYLEPHLCADLLCEVVGCESPTNFNWTRIPVMVAHYPSLTTRKNLVHWSQLETGFRHYDYGKIGNQQHYNSSVPPPYLVSNLMTKVAVIYGQYDKFCPLSNSESTLKLIPKDKLVAQIELPYGHLDFIFSLDGKDKLFPPILKLLQAL